MLEIYHSESVASFRRALVASMDGQLAQASLGLGSQTTPWIQMGISEYLDELTPKQQEVFRASFGETANLNDVLSALQQQQKRTSSQKRAIFIRQMEALSKPLQQFSTALDVVVQAQAVASLIWGPLKAVVLVSRGSYNNFWCPNRLIIYIGG